MSQPHYYNDAYLRKKNLTLDLMSNIKRAPVISFGSSTMLKKHSPVFLSSPDLEKFQLATPDIEKFITDPHALESQSAPMDYLKNSKRDERKPYNKRFPTKTIKSRKQSQDSSDDHYNNSAFETPKFSAAGATTGIQNLKSEDTNGHESSGTRYLVNDNDNSREEEDEEEFFHDNGSNGSSSSYGYGSDGNGTSSVDSSQQESIDVLPNAHVCMPQSDEKKLERKRERNRLAASKCRSKKLERIAYLEEKKSKLENDNEKLEKIKAQLMKHVQALKSEVQQHAKAGCSISIRK